MNNPLDFIHRFVPGAAGVSGPVLLLLHGTGGNENDLIDLGHSLAPGASLLSPRGKVLENGMPRFFRRLAEGVFDEEDLIRRTHELAKFVKAASEYYRFDADNVIVVGYSNGANIAASGLLLCPGLFRGAVLLRAMVPLLPKVLPDLAGVPVYLASGKHDSLVPPHQVEQLAAMLKQAGADVALGWSDSGHQLASAELGKVRQWLAGRFF